VETAPTAASHDVRELDPFKESVGSHGVMHRTVVAAMMALSLGLLGAPGAEAQSAGKVWRVGFLGDGSLAERAAISLDPFRAGLRELGYVEGGNVVVDARWSEGKSERLPDLARELVDAKVDVIVTHGVRGTKAAQAATGTIPIVMAVSPDPVGTGLVASLARPGGNTTGLTDQVAELGAKEIQILREVVPRARRVAILWNEGNLGARPTFEQTRDAAVQAGLVVATVAIRNPEDLDDAVARAAAGRPDVLIVIHDTLTVSRRAQIARLALQHKLPSICASTPFVDAGGLVAYAPSLTGLFKRAAVFVDRILRGAKPADIPIEQPLVFQLRINLKTAKALGLTIPPAVLERADEVIE
jgi:putative tryptophan/tyrosine transport system substrate-binding protein